MLREGLFYKKHDDKVKCFLCPHSCVIGENKFGACSTRTNINGTLKTINYGEVSSIAIDPIEKKPLYHFKPTKEILSVGSFGCNFTCDFCQNYQIAQYKPNCQYVSPQKLIELSLKEDENIGIAFTYNEPSIWYEYIYDTAKELKENHPELNIVLVTNGYIGEEPLTRLLPYVDAMNIDLKAFQEEYYRKICGGNIKAVLKTIERASERCHVEITTLLVRDLNDSKEEVEEIASFLGKLNKNIPLHLSRYFPTYKMDKPATDINVMLTGRDIAKQYLNYVYLGNIQNVDNSTYCPECGNLLVERKSFLSKLYIDKPVCPKCNSNIKIIL